MRGVFDEEEEVERQKQDTELTLGSGTLLAIFFGLVLLCGLCFGMGYAVGHRNSVPVAITTPQPAPDQEPLQASGSIPKPSAIAQTPVNPPDAAALDSTAPADAGTQPAPATAAPTSNPPAQNGEAAAQVRPALPASASQAAQNAFAPAVRPALPSQPFAVQIAAVSNPQDADVLVSALRKRDYPVSAHRDPGDNLIHVRIGPFANHAIADQWRMKLLNDGYNAIIQP
jgi:DedD protein